MPVGLGSCGDYRHQDQGWDHLPLQLVWCIFPASKQGSNCEIPYTWQLLWENILYIKGFFQCLITKEHLAGGFKCVQYCLFRTYDWDDDPQRPND